MSTPPLHLVLHLSKSEKEDVGYHVLTGGQTDKGLFSRLCLNDNVHFLLSSMPGCLVSLSLGLNEMSRSIWGGIGAAIVPL